MGLAVTMLVSPGQFLTNLSGTGGSVEWPRSPDVTTGSGLI